MTIKVFRYTSDDKFRWDAYCRTSKNSVFFYERDFMDYHSDRFLDHSLMFYEGEKLTAVLPANEQGSDLVSHGGLTYGGLLLTDRSRTVGVGELFEALLCYCKAAGITVLRYKCVPAIYHKYPSEEDLYWLFRNGFALARRDISTTIRIGVQRHLAKGRKWALSRAKQSELYITESSELIESVIKVATQNLEAKYGGRLTHSTGEMEILAERFPENIRTFGVYRGSEFLGGSIVFLSGKVAHTQYIAFTDEGRNGFGFDALMLKWMDETFSGMQYLDFGISTEQDGHWLNEGLIEFKESFGGRGTVCDTYEYRFAATAAA